jgi:hypothetical protein
MEFLLNTEWCFQCCKCTGRWRRTRSVCSCILHSRVHVPMEVAWKDRQTSSLMNKGNFRLWNVCCVEIMTSWGDGEGLLGSRSEVISDSVVTKGFSHIWSKNWMKALKTKWSTVQTEKRAHTKALGWKWTCSRSSKKAISDRAGVVGRKQEEISRSQTIWGLIGHGKGSLCLFRANVNHEFSRSRQI